jgi:hypothetical protein
VWRGPFDLVLRSGRAAVEAGRLLGMEDPTCQVELRVTVSHDVECFDSLASFRSDATESGLKRFESIQLVVSSPNSDCHVDVCFIAGGLLTHHGPERYEWLRRGVLIQVHGPKHIDIALAQARDNLKRAVGRGWQSVDGIYHGSQLGDDLRTPVGSVLDSRRKLSIETRLLASICTVAAVVAFSALLSALTGGWPIQHGARSGQYQAQLWWVIVLFLAFPVGATLSARMYRAVSGAFRSVSIGRTGSASWRLGTLLLTTTGGRFVGALASLVVASLLGFAGAK